jgi:pimeloyl-ACP methyl ester carboxylesterase
MDLSKIERRRDADEQLKQYIPDFGIRQFLLKNLERGPKGGYQWKMNLEAIENAYPNILEGVTAEEPFEKPTLFIRGGKSDYLKKSAISDYQQLFPESKLATIEGAGHWVHAEAPEAFIQSITQFFSD